MDHKTKTSEHIWQPEKRLLTISSPFLVPTTNSIKMKLNFQRTFDNSLSKFLSKEVLACIGYIFRYLPNLVYVQWVTSSTLDLKVPSTNPTEVLSWALVPNRTMRLLLIKQHKAQ